MSRRRALLIGVPVFAVALAGLLLLRSAAAPHPAFPRAQATHAALRDPRVARFLDGHRWTRARTIALDDSHWRVTFSDGPRLLLDAAVGPRGKVAAVELHPGGGHPPGSQLLWGRPLFVLFSLVFAGALAVRPLRRMQNLDVAVLGLGFGAALVLYDERLPAAEMYVAAATLGYVAIRCLRIGFGNGHEWQATAPLLADERLVRIAAAAAFVAAVTLTITSTGISDVALAGLAGATQLNHGVLPYGHLTTDVVHGDTYPLLSYVLYMPFAALAPVYDSFSNLDGALYLNAIALVVSTVLTYIVSVRMSGSRATGVRLSLAWLTFPAVVLAASSGGNDVPAAALVLAALLVAMRPAAAAAALTLAAWVKVVPLAAFVAWLPGLRRAGLVRALAPAVGLVVAGFLVITAIGGSGGLRSMFHALGFQFERGSWFSLWSYAGGKTAQILFEALVVALAAVVALEVRRVGLRPLGVRRLAALAAGLLLLVQLAASYWWFAYLPWVMPFVLIALVTPQPRHSPPPAPRAP
jgi:hypothetical protein